MDHQLDKVELQKRIIELESLLQEITKEKESEEITNLAWTGNLGHWYWKVESNEVVFNPLKVTVLGYGKDEIPEKITYQFFTDKLHPDDYEKTMKAMVNHLYGKKPVYEAEYRIRTKEGLWKWFYDRGKVTHYNEQGKPVLVVGIVFDITAKKEMEMELRQKNLMLARASEFKSKFLADISHELRNPLTGIVGIAQLFSDTDLTPLQAEYMDILNNAVERLYNIVNGVLDLSKIEAGMMKLEQEVFNLPEIIDKISKDFHMQCRAKGLNFAVRMPEGLPTRLIGDHNRINQILYNLLGNAVKFTQVGNITLEIQPLQRTTHSIQINVKVADTGIGIEPKKIGSLFKDYTQVHATNGQDYGGTGLGLSITKKLVEMMGGKLLVESTPGEGSTFSFTIELEMSMERPKESLEPKRSLCFRGRRILIIEDDTVTQKLLHYYLQKEACHIYITANTTDGLQYMTEHDLDLILLDMYLPGMNGLELAKRIRQVDKDKKQYVPIIAITGSIIDKEAYVGSGIDDIVSKPFRSDALFQVMDQVLKQEQNWKCSKTQIQELFKDDPAVLQEIIVELTENNYAYGIFTDLERTIDGHDYDEVAKYTHKLRGSLSYFKVDILTESLRKLERYAKEKEGEKVKEIFLDIRIYYQRLEWLLAELKQEN